GGSLLRAPWPDASFDAALAFRLLPHVERWRELLAELCRLARRVVIVDYPTSRSVNAVSGALFGVKKGIEGDTRPFRVFRDAEIEDTLAAASFRTTDRRPQFLLLRRRGGRWASADLTPEVVASIKDLVKEDVHQVEPGPRLPFADAEFDRVVVVDMLEHVADEARFAAELARITKPGGRLVVNT